MTLQEIVAKCAHFPKARACTEEDVPLSTVKRSLVLPLPTWSGQSLAALGRSSRVLSGDQSALELLVFDMDCLSVSALELLGTLAGRGETFWMHGGEIVARLSDPLAEGAELPHQAGPASL